MVGTLLMRGMLVGILAGLLSFCFLKIVGEPAVDRAIAFESAMDAAKADEAVAKGMPAPKDDYDPQLVSRPVQAGLGLLTGVTVYNTAFGGLFALVFALAYGRMGDFSPRGTSALLAAAGFVAVYGVPNLKYPANPPSVGDPATIGMRTALYFSMIAISLAAIVASAMIRGWLLKRFGGWNASLAAAAFYVVAMVGVSFALPAVNEVPDQFPAVVLWQFRMASLGAQLIMWAVIGLGFGAWVESATRRSSGWRWTPATLH